MWVGSDDDEDRESTYYHGDEPEPRYDTPYEKFLKGSLVRQRRRAEEGNLVAVTAVMVLAFLGVIVLDVSVAIAGAFVAGGIVAAIVSSLASS